MIHKAKDLSPDQKLVVDRLLGRSVADNEAISSRASAPDSAPEWLRDSWQSAMKLGLDSLSMEQIAAEVDAALKARPLRQKLHQQ